MCQLKKPNLAESMAKKQRAAGNRAGWPGASGSYYTAPHDARAPARIGRKTMRAYRAPAIRSRRLSRSRRGVPPYGAVMPFLFFPPLRLRFPVSLCYPVELTVNFAISSSNFLISSLDFRVSRLS